MGRLKVPTDASLAKTLNSRERLMDFKITTMMVQLNASCSYRQTVDAMNGMLIRNGEKLAYKTISDYLIRLGTGAEQYVGEMCRESLEEYGFDPEAVMPAEDFLSHCGKITECYSQQPSEITPDTQKRIDKYNGLESHKDCQITKEIAEAEMAVTEDPSHTIYVAIDDICLKAQKTTHEFKNKASQGKDPGATKKSDENQSKLEAAYSEYVEKAAPAQAEENYDEANAAADLEEAAAEVDRQDLEQAKLEESQGKEGEEAKKPGGKKKGRKASGKSGKKGKKGKNGSRVWHTHAEIIDGRTGRVYRFHARGKLNVIRQVLAFLLKNHMLEGNDLVFLTDGADDIRALIQKHFAFRKYRIILDWYHVKKKCNEYISMAFKCKLAEKREIRRGVFIRLWPGQVSAAIDYLNGLEVEKDSERFDDLIGYLTRKQPYIPCFAVRRMLGLHNSSQFVEKNNDLIVAARQKHNGMSWSWDGSNASAALRTFEINGELDNYLRTGTIKFEPIDTAKSKCAAVYIDEIAA